MFVGILVIVLLEVYFQCSLLYIYILRVRTCSLQFNYLIQVLDASAEKSTYFMICQEYVYDAVPNVLSADKLEEVREMERKDESFTPPPNSYYMELTKLLLNQ